MHLCRAIDPQARLARQPRLVALPIKRAFAHCQHGTKRGGTGAALDHPGEAIRQADRLTHPIANAGLQLRRCRRGLPKHALRRDGRDEIFRQHRDRRGIGGKIGKEAGVLPMGHAGHESLFEIVEDRLHRLGPFGRGIGQGGKHRAGGHLRAHRAVAQTRVVIGGPIGGAAAPSSELLPIHAPLPCCGILVVIRISCPMLLYCLTVVPLGLTSSRMLSQRLWWSSRPFGRSLTW